MRRLQASYTRLLTPSAPPAPAPAAITPPERSGVRTVAEASARADSAASAASAAEAAASAAEPAAAAAAAAAADNSASAATAAASDAAPEILSEAAPAASSAIAAAAASAAGLADAMPQQPQIPGPLQADVVPAMAASTAPTGADDAAASVGVAASGSGRPLPGAVLAAASSSGALAPAAPASAGAAVALNPELLDGVAWPVSTRLRYQLSGWYRGEVSGRAQVEWLREGRRYQVHLEVQIGPSFAPLVRRRMSSEGQIGPDGLVPQRYEQETWQIIGRTRRADMVFGAEQVQMASGQRLPRPLDVQDTASQFVQMVFLLTRRPELAQAGQSVDFALALPHRIDRWTYDMVGPATLDTPVGRVQTVHVRPRRRAGGGDMTVQMWLAPSLQMLPARIRIEQDEDTWADLLLLQAPEQAAK
jgi:hypothetical protein